MKYKRVKRKAKRKDYPKNGTWSRMCHKWWLINICKRKEFKDEIL